MFLRLPLVARNTPAPKRAGTHFLLRISLILAPVGWFALLFLGFWVRET